ncbi:peptidylprolyl isomerase [Xylanibacillus composti]|nr:peptidylprolyl isomerase [Xylanibacillus composti]
MKCLAVVSILTVLAACGQNQDGDGGKQAIAMQWPEPPEMTIDPERNYTAKLHTSKGIITLELFAKDAPITVNNFVFLAEQGFYDGVTFHRIIQHFMIQTGDPIGDGTGGPGYRFEDELPSPHVYEPGIVAMANGGPNTNGSQFFICSGPSSYSLNERPNYTIFGKVTEGMDVVEDIASAPVKMNPKANPNVEPPSMPTEDIYIQKVDIIAG